MLTKFGELLKSHISKNKSSIQKLSDEINKDYASLSNAMHGRVKISESDILEIKKCLGLSFSESEKLFLYGSINIDSFKVDLRHIDDDKKIIFAKINRYLARISTLDLKALSNIFEKYMEE